MSDNFTVFTPFVIKSRKTIFFLINNKKKVSKINIYSIFILFALTSNYTISKICTCTKQSLSSEQLTKI